VLRTTYDAVYPHLMASYPDLWNSSAHTYQSFINAAINVWGRGFDANAQDDTDLHRRIWILVPLIDVVNHQSYVGSYFSDLDNRNTAASFDSWATECYTEGAEVFQSYGSHRSSSHFFLYYGFLPDGHERGDYVSFKLDPATIEDKKALFSHSWYSGFAGVDGHISEYFIADFAEYLENRHHDGIRRWDSPTQATWRLAIVTLLKTVRRTQQELPTTLEEDIAELEQGFEVVGFAQWSILSVRVRFKTILEAVATNLHHRANSEDVADPANWMDKGKPWLLVHDEDHQTQQRRHQDASIDESLMTVEVVP